MKKLPVHIKIVFVMVLSAWLVSCSTAPHVYTNASRQLPPKYSLIFMIHGDANYVFHDTAGVAHQANEEVLTRAKAVALANPQAEVFIFHEKPLRKVLFFFKQPDGEFYHYRNGELAVTQPYWRHEGTSRFSVQGALYHAHRWKFNEDDNEYVSHMFLYFGHEIPEFGKLNYDESFPDSTLTINKFSNDLQSFTNPERGSNKIEQRTDNKYFDLIVMSTCYNGSFHSVASLAPYTRYIIASPTNLHLSYFDLEPFEHLEKSFKRDSIKPFIDIVAKNVFTKLSARVQTVVGVSAYDVSSVESYLQSIKTIQSQYLTRMSSVPETVNTHCDCAELAPFNKPLMHKGVQVLYRPPLFGNDANTNHHSGWSCWTMVDGQVMR